MRRRQHCAQEDNPKKERQRRQYRKKASCASFSPNDKRHAVGRCLTSWSTSLYLLLNGDQRVRAISLLAVRLSLSATTFVSIWCWRSCGHGFLLLVAILVLRFLQYRRRNESSLTAIKRHVILFWFSRLQLFIRSHARKGSDDLFFFSEAK